MATNPKSYEKSTSKNLPCQTTWVISWDKRHQKNGKSYWEKGSKYYEVAKLQNWKCPICGEPLLNGEEVETHHIVPVAKGGLDDTDNLQHLHAACHKQVHSNPKLKGLK